MSFAIEQYDQGVPGQADGLLLFVDEAGDANVLEGENRPDPWRILIADDDEEVHTATTFALRGVEIDGRPLILLHAFSAAEAIEVLQHTGGVAVAMLDVVMETSDAGLKLVETIREALKLRSMRIVLRTGQPGYAPELEVIKRYDINDYRTKSELSQTRLITTITAAARAYEQIEDMHAANRGMDAVAKSANTVFRLHDSRQFAQVVLERLKELIGQSCEIMVVMDRPSSSTEEAGLKILCGLGRYASLVGCVAEGVVDVELLRAMRRCLAARTTIFEAGRVLLYLGNGSRDAVVIIDHPDPLRAVQRRLVEMFAASLKVGFENVDLIERLDFFAFHDPLTHLPNRTRFINDVDQDLIASQGRSRCLALVDVVRFGEVNDALGYRCGDSLLVAVARRLRTALGAGVVVARVSGDTFGVYGSENALDQRGLNKAFEAPFFVHGHALTVQLRTGMVRLAECKGNAVELMRNASLALRHARESCGGAFCVFSGEMTEDVQGRVSMLHNLRAAIDFKRGLAVYYQPVVDAADGALRGIEALLRWRNDSGEWVPPARFIPMAERTGMINELGMWVLEQALERLAVWQRQGWQALELTVNVSCVQLRCEGFVASLKSLLDYHDLRASSLILDLSEDIAREDQDLLASQLKALHKLGVRLALDDLGSGLVALRSLLDLPVDVLKIDRMFVEQMAEAGGDKAVAASIAALAHGKGLQLQAEGVEHAGQAELLREMGCKFLQGYHFARPMAVEQMDAWLRARHQIKA